MRRITVYLAAALALSAMAGCGKQPETTTSTEAPAAEAAAEQTQDEIIAELKDAIATAPSYKSVTVTESIVSTYTGKEIEEANGGPDVIEQNSTYEFDASGDQLKTHLKGETNGVVLEYYSDGDNAVFVSDGPIYSGTTEQFDLTHFEGVDAYLTDTIGDLNTLVDCASTVSKEQVGDTASYQLTLDPRKYMDSDEALLTLEKSGSPIQNAQLTIYFDAEGRIAGLKKHYEFPEATNDITDSLSDFDATTVAAMPEATKTFEELEADREIKFHELFDGLEELNDDAEETEAE